jgi:hypothetical protein
MLQKYEWHILPTHTEQPEDITTSSGLLFIKYQCQVFPQQARLLRDFFLYNINAGEHNSVMTL